MSRRSTLIIIRFINGICDNMIVGSRIFFNTGGKTGENGKSRAVGPEKFSMILPECRNYAQYINNYSIKPV